MSEKVDPTSWLWENPSEHQRFRRIVTLTTGHINMPTEVMVDLAILHPEILNDLPLSIRRALTYLAEFGPAPSVGHGHSYNPINNTVVCNGRSRKEVPYSEFLKSKEKV